MFSVTAGDWVALSALIVTGLGMAGTIAFRVGQVAGAVRDLAGRQDRCETRLARIEQKLDRRSTRGLA
jgi:outer membrane murein-binding lipoprotein Lpp